MFFPGFWWLDEIAISQKVLKVQSNVEQDEKLPGRLVGQTEK